jgi:hypothetical protein
MLDIRQSNAARNGKNAKFLTKFPVPVTRRFRAAKTPITVTEMYDPGRSTSKLRDGFAIIRFFSQQLLGA